MVAKIKNVVVGGNTFQHNLRGYGYDRSIPGDRELLFLPGHIYRDDGRSIYAWPEVSRVDHARQIFKAGGQSVIIPDGGIVGYARSDTHAARSCCRNTDT